MTIISHAVAYINCQDGFQNRDKAYFTMTLRGDNLADGHIILPKTQFLPFALGQPDSPIFCVTHSHPLIDYH